ncbi:MAG: hypothetical protein A3E87_02255 [Gammaproteobacteria bacterium RIFCSPHIGHO2_12_FULL_35_23]|nr:MAG: hypothetical protein A3E87_02255 [Gammaproteobacteria bacterium RIFCSPHIGHO2_12_FULL_35_23]
MPKSVTYVSSRTQALTRLFQSTQKTLLDLFLLKFAWPDFLAFLQKPKPLFYKAFAFLKLKSACITEASMGRFIPVLAKINRQAFYRSTPEHVMQL